MCRVAYPSLKVCVVMIKCLDALGSCLRKFATIRSREKEVASTVAQCCEMAGLEEMKKEDNIGSGRA